MTIRTQRREAAIERMADHLLTGGLGASSLRAMAAAAGVSDRMLLYYFSDKDELLGATLQRVAARLTDQLEQIVPPGRRYPPRVLLSEVWTALRSDAVQPFMLLWLDLAAAAARSSQPHASVVGAIADGFLAWIASHLDTADDGGRAAAWLLASIEGLLVLDAVGRKAAADSAFTVMMAEGDPPASAPAPMQAQGNP